MILQITLEDPKRCKGCPCLEGGIFCKFYDIELKMTEEEFEAIRPEKCIEENSI